MSVVVKNRYNILNHCPLYRTQENSLGKALLCFSIQKYIQGRERVCKKIVKECMLVGLVAQKTLKRLVFAELAMQL
jgi:hypothetical protein